MINLPYTLDSKEKFLLGTSYFDASNYHLSDLDSHL